MLVWYSCHLSTIASRRRTRWIGVDKPGRERPRPFLFLGPRRAIEENEEFDVIRDGHDEAY